MKVVGSGSPRMLTVAFEPCEIALVREELEELARSLVTSIADTQRWLGEGRGEVSERERDLEGYKDELVLVSALSNELRDPAPSDRPRELTGPTELLGRVIRSAALEAAERLHEAVEWFGKDRGTPTPGELRARLDVTSACVETLIGLDHAQNHGMV